MSLREKICLVTGAGRGIGKAIAEKLAAKGAFVVVNDVDARLATSCAEGLQQQGLHAEACEADVSVSAEVKRMFAETYLRHGQLDVLINNAAISQPRSLLDTSDERWQQVMAVNLSGVFYCCREAFPLMETSGGGRIVNLSSVSAFTGKVLNENASYVASKAGINGLTRALAVEGLQRNITVNAVAPGIVETDVHAHMTPEKREQLPSLVPMNRLASSAEVAEAVYYLVSPASSYITGHVLHLNGGMFME